MKRSGRFSRGSLLPAKLQRTTSSSGLVLCGLTSPRFHSRQEIRLEFSHDRKFSTTARNTIDRLPPTGRTRRGIKGIIIQGTAPLHRTARRGFIGSLIPDLGAEETEPLTHFEKHTLPYEVLTLWNCLSNHYLSQDGVLNRSLTW